MSKEILFKPFHHSLFIKLFKNLIRTVNSSIKVKQSLQNVSTIPTIRADYIASFAV